MSGSQCCTALLLALLLLPATLPAQTADCTFDAKHWNRPERERWREVSALTESVGRGRPARRGDPGAIEIRNFIDEEIFATMRGAGIKPAAISTDEEFLRRVTLDLTGEIPDADTVRAFTSDFTSDKRLRAVDRLLASEQFADRWTMWFGDLVLNVQFSTFSREAPQGRLAFYKWIRDSFRSGKPYDQIVREVIAGRGDSFVDGTANYIVRQIQPNGPIQDTYDNLAAHSAERFLGLPLNCISCHSGLRHLESVNSYLATRSRMDFWRTAAFFAPAQARRIPDPAQQLPPKFLVSDIATNVYRLNTVSGNKTPRQPAEGQPNTVAPVYFLTGETPSPGENWRDAYGRFLTADRQFARATVNYVWREMFGLALVEPPDSMDLFRIDPATLPPGGTLQTLHPRLLERLTDEFRRSGYDFRALIRTISSSSAYQLSMTYEGSWNETWTPYFARHYARRLPAEMMFDAIVRATGVTASLNVNGSTPVNRAMLLPDPLDGGRIGQFLNGFGRGDRDDTIRTDESSITQSLMLLNDQLVTARVRQSAAGSTVQRTLAATRDPALITEAIYLATLSRRPNASERSIATGYLQSGDIVRKTEDLQYVLLNSLEFQFN